MTALIMIDSDHSPAGRKRRLKEEFARHDIGSESAAAARFNVPQQWLSRRMTGETEWKVDELEEFCSSLGLSYIYVTTGIRPIPPVSPGDYGDGSTAAGTVSSLPGRRRRHRSLTSCSPKESEAA